MRGEEGTPPPILRCSFCNRDQNDVPKMIAGPGVFICNECVDICNTIIADDRFFTKGTVAGGSTHWRARDIVTPSRDVARDERLTQWTSGVAGVEIEQDLAEFIVSSGNNAVIDLWFECETALSELKESGATAVALPLELRTRLTRLAQVAQKLGLVSSDESFFAPDDVSRGS